MSREFVEIEVAEVIRETADSCSVVLDIPDALKERFSYRAGQFLTFEIPWEDFEIGRCYSLASAPGLDPAPKVTVKRVPDGRMSNWMNDNVKPGSWLRVSPPEGRFVLNEDAGVADLSLFGAGSGITPVISLAKSALATTSRNVKLLYANRDAENIIFKAELDSLEEKYHGRFKVVHHLDSESGFLTCERVRAELASRTSGEFYTCGPAPFMDVVEAALEAEGVPTQHMHFERFISPMDPDRQEEGEDITALAQVPESVVIKLDRRKHQIPYERGETLLAAAKRAGVNPPSSCEDGFCGSCLAQLVRGDVRMKSHKALTENEVEKGRVLLCQSIPTSTEPLLVDYDASSFKIKGNSEDRKVPRLVGAVVFVFVVIAVWILRSTG